MSKHNLVCKSYLFQIKLSSEEQCGIKGTGGELNGTLNRELNGTLNRN